MVPGAQLLLVSAAGGAVGVVGDVHKRCETAMKDLNAAESEEWSNGCGMSAFLCACATQRARLSVTQLRLQLFWREKTSQDELVAVWQARLDLKQLSSCYTAHWGWCCCVAATWKLQTRSCSKPRLPTEPAAAAAGQPGRPPATCSLTHSLGAALRMQAWWLASSARSQRVCCLEDEGQSA